MLYTAKLTKRKKIFQPAYEIKDGTIYITNTKRAKKRFLKSGIKNVVFGKEFKADNVFGKIIKPLYAYDKSFLMDYLEEMIVHLAHFLKMSLPVDSIALFSPEAVNVACKYAKMVTVTGKGEDEVINGVNVRYVKKLKALPDAAIVLTEGYIPPLPGVPVVNLCENAPVGKNCSTWETMSFKCSLLPFEISAASLIYLLNENAEMTYELCSLRKKCPMLFTFC